MLTANALREFSYTSDTYTVFAEWLAQYFDGVPHAVGGQTAVPFTTAVLRFGQSVLPQPLNPVATTANPAAARQASISMVWGAPIRPVDLRWETVDGVTQQMAYRLLYWNFWVRCEDATARRLCRQTAEQLSALLGNAAATRALGQKGIMRLRPTAPEPVAEGAFILMLVSCRGTLRHAVLSQDGALPPAPLLTTTEGRAIEIV